MTTGTTVMVLCLGQASRMRPLSQHIPKALLPFCGRPLLEYLLWQLAASGLSNIVLVANRKDERYCRYVSNSAVQGANVSVEERGLEYGSAGVVMDVAEARSEALDSEILVIYGDSLLSIDFRSLLRVHRANRERGGMMTVVYHRPDDLIVSGNRTTNYGLLELDGVNRLTRFIEKPAIEDISSSAASAAVFVLDRAVFGLFPKKRPLDFSNDVLPTFVANEKTPVFGFSIGKGYRFDIGTINDYRNRQFDVLEGRLIVGGVPSSLIYEDCKLPSGGDLRGKAMIGEGCAFDTGVKITGPAVLGKGVSIRASAEVCESVILDGATIGKGAKLIRVVAGPGSVVQDGTCLSDQTIVEADSAVDRDQPDAPCTALA